MERIANYLQAHWRELLVPLIVFGITFLVGFLIRRSVFSFLHRVAATTASKWDDIIIDTLKRPSLVWILIGSLVAGAQFAPISDETTSFVNKVLLILWIVSLTLAVAALLGRAVRQAGTQIGDQVPVNSLTENLIRGVALVLGGLLILNELGISVTPILTALGVGGLAVALALQPTLSNLFAGFYMSVAKHVRVGDYIKLDSGEEGYVSDITWRSTIIRVLANNLIIVPNSKLAEAIITNYHLPETRMSLLVPIGVSYDSDPDEIERILIESSLEVAEYVPGLLKEPPPFVRFIPGFGDSSLNFTLICQVKEFVDQYLAQHEIRKVVFKKFRAAGVEIPFPIRTVYLKGDKGVLKSGEPVDGQYGRNAETPAEL